ncbi:MAG: aspartate-semialdehyde dehydrogenase [Hyphomonas sp.]
MVLAPKLAAAGSAVIDNSPAWRSDTNAALVVAEINRHALRSIPKGNIANPNCKTMAAMPVLKPVLKQLHDRAGLKRLAASTCQAGSGAGVAGVAELELQIDALGKGAGVLASRGGAMTFPAPKKWAVPIAINGVALNYKPGEDGYTDEELKPRDETRKILEIPGLPVSGTCVCVPVCAGHSVPINAQFGRPVSAAAATGILGQAPGVVVTGIPNALEATGRDPVYVGRIRPDRTRAARPRAVAE